ncbi:hypothetical protein [Nocardioides sp. GXZ039]|uniref:hypothetical protein n=1 Tax=Nocardioides sp. GXZ039 TaxID=3136018 RepID=UPI0030F3F622
MNLKSAPVTILLGSVALVLLVALGWMALISPALGAIGETGDARAAAQDRADSATAELTRLRGQQANLPKTEKQADRLNAMWPATADQPAFFGQVADAASAAGISLDDLTVLSPGVPALVGVDPNAPDTAAPKPEDASVSDIAAQEVTIGAKGDYESLAKFMAALEQMPRALLVSTATYEDDGGEGPVLTVVGKTFVAPPLTPPAS